MYNIHAVSFYALAMHVQCICIPFAMRLHFMG
jgi:hypothetical protein